MKIRRLNSAGIDRFERFIDSITGLTALEVPFAVLEDPSLSDALDVDVSIEQRTFASRLELGEYLFARLANSGLRDVDSDAGMWAWLALFYFDVLCPATGPNGKRMPGDRARWILDPENFQRYYRHLLAGPFRVVRAYSDAPHLAMCVLCGPPDRPGEMVEQLASRQELVTNRAIIEAATKLYWNGNSGLKRGAGGKGAGSARRFAAVLQQFDVTFDLYELTCRELLDLLPCEFNRFRGP